MTSSAKYPIKATITAIGTSVGDCIEVAHHELALFFSLEPGEKISVMYGEATRNLNDDGEPRWEMPITGILTIEITDIEPVTRPQPL